MKFNFIPQPIIDLYIDSLVLSILQDNLSDTGPDGLTSDIKLEIDIAANNFVKSSKIAENLLGSEDAVQLYLDKYYAQRQGDA